jgi:hypothetical protein
VWCTKPSIIQPHFNFTHIQANDNIYPATVKGRIHTAHYTATVILHLLSFTIFLLISLPWYITPLLRFHRRLTPLAIKAVWFQFFLAFILNLATYHLEIYSLNLFNSVDNFYQPAPCGTKRLLKPGVLMMVKKGKSYQFAWIAWVMTFVLGLAASGIRVLWLHWESEDAIKKEKAMMPLPEPEPKPEPEPEPEPTIQVPAETEAETKEETLKEKDPQEVPVEVLKSSV